MFLIQCSTWRWSLILQRKLQLARGIARSEQRGQLSMRGTLHTAVTALILTRTRYSIIVHFPSCHDTYEMLHYSTPPFRPAMMSSLPGISSRVTILPRGCHSKLTSFKGESLSLSDSGFYTGTLDFNFGIKIILQVTTYLKELLVVYYLTFMFQILSQPCIIL